MARRCNLGWLARPAPPSLPGRHPRKSRPCHRFNATQARFEAAFARAKIATVVTDDTTFFGREEVRAPSAGQPGPGLTRPAGTAGLHFGPGPLRPEASKGAFPSGREIPLAAPTDAIRVVIPRQSGTGGAPTSSTYRDGTLWVRPYMVILLSIARHRPGRLLRVGPRRLGMRLTTP